MKRMILSIGRSLVVLITTLISIVISVGITLFVHKLAGKEVEPYCLFVSVIAPSVAAPAMSWYSYGLLFETHRIKEEMFNLSTYDMITGVMTRRAFMTNCELAYDRACRNQSPFSYITIDIDDFKKINDTYGHAGGDAVLKSFGETIKRITRKNDLVGRIGGEEFALALSSTNLAGAVVVADKILLATRIDKIDCRGQSIHYTVSIGISQFEGENPNDLEQLIRESDKALYAAKNTGKDRAIALGMS